MLYHNFNCVEEFTQKSFIKAVDILLTKPHIINKRLWGNNILFKFICDAPKQELNSEQSFEKLDNVTLENIEKYGDYILKELGLEISEINVNKNFEVQVIELLPKNYTDVHAYQLILFDKNEAKVSFYDVTPKNQNQNLSPEFPYTLMLKANEIIFKAFCNSDSKTYKWLINLLLPQFIKWGKDLDNNAVTHNICTESLALVSKNIYYHKYNELKLKYGKEMVKIWPECTDPVKFVYEDVAIAAYLLLLWEDSDNISKKQTFVDLGCGNGLLVYILTKEGHNGVGIDVRKRHIWDMYSNDIKLEERTIVPSETSLFPDADWVIGNHSDELTPWIPVLAARSSYKCNFFVLPCCAYNFDGSKYQRKNSNKSQYIEYLEYIKSLCQECGFAVDIDRLKIPSTKRICLVSKGRMYPENAFNDYCHKIQTIIERGCNLQEEEIQNSLWIKDFKVRESVEPVRNCTKIDKNLIESIVGRITTYLLKDSCKEPQWSLGNTVDINEVVQIIPQSQLKQLKSECGGLQTLLKNNHQIFKVQSGKVQLRYPKTVDEVNNNLKRKKKSTILKMQCKHCWFFNNHPQGCPLTDANCSFLHVTQG